MAVLIIFSVILQSPIS